MFGAVIAVGVVVAMHDEEGSQVLTDGRTIAQTTEHQEVDGRRTHRRSIACRWEATTVGRMPWMNQRLEDPCLRA
jgi:hypothetical protein